jgi:hypothetical protein
MSSSRCVEMTKAYRSRIKIRYTLLSSIKNSLPKEFTEKDSLFILMIAFASKKRIV